MHKGVDVDFEGVYDRNYAALCLYAVRFVRDFTEAEDLVQEVFVRFWEVLQKDGKCDCARGYLYRMVRNACIDHLRGKKTGTVDAVLLADELVDFFQPESEEGAGIDRLLEAVERLPEKCRQVFVAICVNERKYKDVADEMQVSVNTIKTQLSRGLKLLREGLDKEDFNLFLTFFINFD